VGEPWVPPRWTIPTFIRARLPAAGEQPADGRACEQELRPGGNAYAVPADATVEELLPVRPEPGYDVLEIGHRGRGAAEHGRIERAAPRGEQPERDEAAADLEAPVGNVLVRHLVAGEVQRRAEQERERTRAEERAGRAAGRHVE